MNRFIVAIDRNRGMAKKGIQPWYIPSDEQYFTEQTLSHGGAILVGQKTFATFKGPLKDRTNYVLSRHPDYHPDGVEVVPDLAKFMDNLGDQDLWVVGGASVFEQSMPWADELYITKIDADFGCDQFFPVYNVDYSLASQSEPHQQNGFLFHNEIWRRKTTQ